MAKENKKSIYILRGLIDVYHDCQERGKSFSKRLADIEERYSLVLSMTEIPELTDTEKIILGEAVLGTTMDKISLKYLHENVADVAVDGSQELAKKIKALSYLQRMALIEKLGI